jgi:hypothetical protein
VKDYCCLHFQYFQPSAELCFFVHIILPVCEIWFKISMCICSVRIPSFEYSLFTWNLSIFRFNLAVLLYRLGKSISFSRFKFKNCKPSHQTTFLLLLPLWQNLMTFRSMIVFLFYRCVIWHLRQTFKPTAESCIFVHIILQETEECKMWPLSIFRFNPAVLLYRLGKSISFSRFNCKPSHQTTLKSFVFLR